MSREDSLASRLRESLWRGQPLRKARIVDAHGHLGPWPPAWVHSCDAAAMVAAMHRIGVELACLSHFAGLGSNHQYGNDQAAAAVALFPQRFLYYAVINPHDADQVLPEIQRCFARGGCVGVKLHSGAHGVTASHPGYEAIWEYADTHHLLALCHGSTPAEFDALSTRWPHVIFIEAHGTAWKLSPHDPMAALYRERPNIFGDTSGSMVATGALEQLVDIIGPKKVLFGSDFPLMDLAHQLGRPLWSDLDDESLRLILGENFLGLLAQIVDLHWVPVMPDRKA